MKRLIIVVIIVLINISFVSQILQAQGTVYISNLNQTSTGSLAVGSDSMILEGFSTGRNVGGYVLNSIQLAMTDASGNPNGFTVMLYDDSTFQTAGYLGSSLDTLNGSLNPITGGIFAYTPSVNIVLSPNSRYFILLASATSVATGAYQWSLTIPNSYNPIGGWKAGSVWASSDGSGWTSISGTLQFAITATPVPEPSISSLFALSGLGLLYYYRKPLKICIFPSRNRPCPPRV